VVSLLSVRGEADSLTLARIQKDREAALARYLRERDSAGLEAVMARLDAEEAGARAVTTPSGSRSWAQRRPQSTPRRRRWLPAGAQHGETKS
jgi:hypothetical protein